MRRPASQAASLMLFILLLSCPISWCIADQVNEITQDTDTFASESFQIKRILVIGSSSYTEPYDPGIRGGIHSVLDPMSTIRYTTESLRPDSQQSTTDYNAYLETFSHFLLTQYYETPFHAIIAVNDDALEFIQEYRDILFPDTPVISSSIYIPHSSKFRERDIAFVHGSSIEKTLEFMMTQHPDARSLYVLLPSSQGETNAQRVVDEFIANHPDWVDTYYASLYMTQEDLLAEMKAMPDLDLVLLQGYDFSDEANRLYPILQSVPRFTSEIDAPFYVISDTYNEKGVVGGFEVELNQLGIILANAALDVVYSTETESLPSELRVREIEPKPIFIYETLERFGISQHSLPPHAVVIGRPETLIPISPEVLYGGTILLVVLFIIVCLLGYEEIKMKRANAEIIKEKELLAHVVASIPIGICAMDAQDDRKYLLFNNKLGDLLGLDPKKVIGTFFPLEPLRIDEHRGESLSARCIRTRCVSESELTYKTPTGNKTFYALCYPTFDENDALKEIMFHYVDRTEERAWEREIEKSLTQFRSFFEQDIVITALYEAVYDNGNVTSFRYIDINSEYERLIGASRDEVLDAKITPNEPYFESFCKVLSEKKPLHFQNWYSSRGNKYLSGDVFLFDTTREYLCVTAIDTTHRLQKNKQMLLEQINANLQKLSALNTEMRQPLYEVQETLANEEDCMYLSLIKEQINAIIRSIDELERGFIKSEKIQTYLMKQDHIILIVLDE